MRASLRFQIFIGILILLFFSVCVFSPIAAEAAGLPFGGQILLIFPCITGLKITVGPPRGGVFMYIPGASFSYAYGPPRRVGQWLLGLYGPPAPCFIPGPKGPILIGFFPLIIFHGSSM